MTEQTATNLLALLLSTLRVNLGLERSGECTQLFWLLLLLLRGWLLFLLA
jgi:hypothetical protein